MAGAGLVGGGRRKASPALLSLVALSFVASLILLTHVGRDDLNQTDLLQSGLDEATQTQAARMADRIARALTRSEHAGEWNSTQQEAYDAAVSHARSVERDGHQVYQPLRMSHGFVHEAEIEQETFEEQLVDMVKQLEPSYLAEALDWAESDDTRTNPVLLPIVHSLEKPIIKDLDMEARIRVEHAVEAIAKRHQMGLPEKEQLRAHLMAPLLLRIRSRVHSQVSHYVVKLARNVVLKAANSSNPAIQEIVGQLHGKHAKDLLSVPKLSDGDLKMINALHDLDAIFKSGVIDQVDYNTQKAKLLSDWLKYSVNKAGGNSNEVLRIVFGGDVRGVTDTGIKNPSPISVHKKLRMEKGISSMIQDRNVRLNADLAYHLIHSKEQWGEITGCGKNFDSSPKCSAKWREIKDLVEQYARDDDTDANWGESINAVAHADVHPLHSTLKMVNSKEPASESKHTASVQQKQQRLRSGNSKKSDGLWSWI